MNAEETHEALRAPAMQEVRRRLGIATPQEIAEGDFPGDAEFAAYGAAIRAFADVGQRFRVAVGDAVMSYASVIDTLPPEVREQLEREAAPPPPRARAGHDREARVKDRNGWITVGEIDGNTISVCNNHALRPGTVAVEVENPHLDEITSLYLIISAMDARHLAAALVTLADEIAATPAPGAGR